MIALFGRDQLTELEVLHTVICARRMPPGMRYALNWSRTYSQISPCRMKITVHISELARRSRLPLIWRCLVHHIWQRRMQSLDWPEVLCHQCVCMSMRACMLKWSMMVIHISQSLQRQVHWDDWGGRGWMILQQCSMHADMWKFYGAQCRLQYWEMLKNTG